MEDEDEYGIVRDEYGEVLRCSTGVSARESELRKKVTQLEQENQELKKENLDIISERDTLKEKNKRLKKDLEDIKSLIDKSASREFQIAVHDRKK